MSGNAPDPRLDALLRDLPPPPPLPAGLAARIVAAAAAAPQEARPARARRAATRRDRRGGWLRRPLLAGTAALGLLVTSAVAATLAGVPIPQKIAAVFFPEEKAPEPKQVAALRPVRRTAPAQAAPVRSAEAAPVAEESWSRQPGPWRRLLMLQRIVDARRAMGLPTPGADRMERQLRRRAEMWRDATPEERARWLERRQAHREARQAVLATPEGQAARAAQREQMRRWRAQRQAGIPFTPEQRTERQQLMRQWHAQGIGVPPRPEQRWARQDRMQAWRTQSQAGQPPLTEEERAARQQRFRQWREARRARWQARNGQGDGNVAAGTEGPDAPDR